MQALRQPGSSFKPFVYLTALERGFTPASVVRDEPYEVVIDRQRGKTWSPKNFSSSFKGSITLRKALASSTNVISAKLIMHVGPHAVVDTARRLGLTSYLSPYPALALGASAQMPPPPLVGAPGLLCWRGPLRWSSTSAEGFWDPRSPTV